MVGPSKILTVSYGTFSCTLEGFDDPFSTMRGIAEYFRDLAADDRYFGAEPPTPDADMLHKIAEREVKRRVEARVEDGGVILRQAAEDAPVSTTPVAPRATTTPVAPTAPAQQSTRPRTESVAEKLARLRAAVPENEGLALEGTADLQPAGMGALAAAFQDPQETDDADVELAQTDAETGAAATETAAHAQDFDAEQPPEADQDAGRVDLDAMEFDAEETLPDAALDTEPDTMASDQADDLVDLSDVDLDAEEVAPEADPEIDLSALEFEEDDTENLPAQDDGINLQSILADGPEDQAEGFADAADPGVETARDADETSQAAAAEADAQATDAEADDGADFAALIAAEAAAAEIESEQADLEAEPDEKTVARILKMRRADFEAATQDLPEQPQQPETIIIDRVGADEFGTEPSPLPDMQSEPDAADAPGFDPEEDALAAELARSLNDVSALDDAELDDDAAADADTLEDAFAEAQGTSEPDNVTDDNEATFTESDEADLIASLNLLEDDELDDDDDDDTDFSDVPIAEPRVASTSVERLFEVTNSELAGRESSRRRSAIAHLKAAVAATRADRDFAEKTPNDADKTDADFDITPYREDLARVVRPKRPADQPNSGPRRLPPLMLVSEQRVDDQVEQAVSAITEDAVRPRRVASDEDADHLGDDDSQDNIFAEAGSFAEFAAEMGAHELPDMLEAAAAYYSYVEGQPHFSRPQIMKAVAAINTEGNFTREDGLRSFGQLLRHGKIRKIRRGQFEIDQSTRFKPQPLQLGA